MGSFASGLALLRGPKSTVTNQNSSKPRERRRKARRGEEGGMKQDEKEG